MVGIIPVEDENTIDPRHSTSRFGRQPTQDNIPRRKAWKDERESGCDQNRFDAQVFENTCD
jgi:hypothetical protein